MSEYVLITGASGGIGKATAMLLADKGYNLILVCHKNKNQLIDVISAIRINNPLINVIYYCGNIADSSFCNYIFTDLSSKNISPDIIINNAGVSHIGLLQDLSYEQWHTTIDTNLSSAFYICKNAIPAMIKNRSGKIINISSVWGNVGASCEVAYSASKGGINSFTKALAKELAPSNIQVNAIAFGAIDTAMNSHLSDEDKNSLTDEIPAGRLGTTAEAAHMILSIIESPSYLTGQIITMDGGWC